MRSAGSWRENSRFRARSQSFRFRSSSSRRLSRRRGIIVAPSLPCHSGVTKAVMRQAFVAFDVGAAEGGVLVTSEGEDRPDHLLDVEDPQAHEEVETLHDQADNRLEQVRLD